MSDREVVQAAASIVFGSHTPPEIRRVEILAQRFRAPVRDISIDYDHAPYSLAIVGAPLWVREVLTVDKGEPAPPRMDELGPYPYPFDEIRRAWVEASHRVLTLRTKRDAASYNLRAKQSLREISTSRPRDEDLTQFTEELDALSAQLDKAKLRLDRVLQEALGLATDPKALDDLCSWFTRQAAFTGIPAARLSVYMRPSWWHRLVHRGWRSEMTPAQTDIVGHVVRYGDSQTAQGEVLVTPTGELYPVLVSSYRDDPKAPVVYWPDRPHRDGGLRKGEQPVQDRNHADLIGIQMLHLAYLWRRGLHRDIPETPWTSEQFMDDMGRHADVI